VPEILRIFRARPHRSQQAAYELFLRTTTLPFLRAQRGMKQATVARSFGQGGRTDVVVVSWWASEEDLRAAAGRNWEEGVIDRQAEAPLLEDFTVQHYELLAS
jgi:heme-degrading monooxygenase HmoA